MKIELGIKTLQSVTQHVKGSFKNRDQIAFFNPRHCDPSMSPNELSQLSKQPLTKRNSSQQNFLIYGHGMFSKRMLLLNISARRFRGRR
jgi:hypothetical protein